MGSRRPVRKEPYERDPPLPTRTHWPKLRPPLALVALMTAVFPVRALPAQAEPGETAIGDVTGFDAQGSAYTFSSGQAKIRVAFHRDDIVRIQLAPDGVFTDPANDAPPARTPPPPASSSEPASARSPRLKAGVRVRKPTDRPHPELLSVLTDEGDDQAQWWSAVYAGISATSAPEMRSPVAGSGTAVG